MIFFVEITTENNQSDTSVNVRRKENERKTENNMRKTR